MMDDARERMLALFEMSRLSDEPLSWFNDLYSSANNNRELIPWDWREPHPFLRNWVGRTDHRGKALVVGCGLGEDAAYLSQSGWQVTAFDISESAVSWAAELHRECEVEWMVADLLDLPLEWRDAFDLVLEVHILQAIPEEIRTRAAPKMAPLLSLNGHLVCIGRLNEDESAQDEPPWALSRSFIEDVGKDLKQVEFHRSTIPEKESTRYRAVWTRI